MKRKWHIKTHMLVTLISLTCSILLIVVLVFNAAIYGFIRSRVSTQLNTVLESTFEDRREDPREIKDTKHFNDHPDRIMGTRGSAIILNSDGSLASNIHGDDTVANELSKWLSNNFDSTGLQNKVVWLESGVFALSLTQDPVASGKFLLVYVDVTSIVEFTKLINILLIAVILLAILLSVLISRRIAKSYAEPVRSLSDFADDIGKGNLEPCDLSFRDMEFDLLADSMNRMASDLSDSKKKQEVFFQNVSHELRTPLTSIRGNAEGIAYGIMKPENAAKIIISESEKLGGLVEDILYLSRAGKGKSEGNAQPLDLRETFSLCVSEQRSDADKKGISFTFDFDDQAVMLQIREQAAERMLGNLISNAIRYAEHEVKLRCRNEGDSIYVSVSDDGPGISEEDFPHIFDRMYKGKGGKHGIGLAIAQSVASNCGGKIVAKNNGGAVFEVRFSKMQSDFNNIS